jgi:ATP-dependent RNA helicase DeaD
MKVPTIKSLMKVLRGKIVASVMEVLPPPEMEAGLSASVLQGSDSGPAEVSLEAPFLAKVCGQLLERLGPEQAITALLTLNYGELLDPSRYGPVTEFPEFPAREEGRLGGKFRHSGHERRAPGLPRQRGGAGQGSTRVYVGLGRRHGASPRDVAALLTRAGEIPGRLVEAIEMKDYCAFATMPAEAARRACEFSRKAPKEPVIKPAIPPKK